MSANGYRHYAGLKGTKIWNVGTDEACFNHTSLASAVSAAQSGDTIYLEPGTYSLSSTLTINKSLNIIGRGRCVVNGDTDGIEDRLIMINKPAAGTTSTYIWIENIEFANANASADVFEIDNDGGATGDLIVKFKDCDIDAGASGLAFDIDQTTNTISMDVSIIGNLTHKLDSCNFALTKASSIVRVIGMDCHTRSATFALGTTNVASIYFWKDCTFAGAAITSGGAASIIENVMNCHKVTTGAISALALTDFDATAASENIASAALAT